MDKRQILQRLGLSKNEIEVYLFLINSGPNRITDISHHTRIHRPLVYQAITPLLEKQLINYQTKGKQKYYSAESPNKLNDILQKFQQEMTDLIPELEQTYQKRTTKPAVRFLEGASGISSAHMDMVNYLKNNETYYRYTFAKNYQKINQYIPEEYRQLRKKKNLQRFIISNDPVEKTARKRPDINRVIKIISTDDDKFIHNIDFVVYRDRVAYLDFNSENAFIIENKNIAEFHQSMFKQLWKKIK